MQREVQPVADAVADLVAVLRCARLKKMDSPKPPPNSSDLNVIAPMKIDGIASAMSGPTIDPALLERRTTVVAVAVIIVRRVTSWACACRVA